MSDCRLITISELLRRHGISITPWMCFGLSEGYDFNYWIEKSIKIPMLVMIGKSRNENTLFDNLGVQYQVINEDTDLESMVVQRKNVIVNVDRYYLDYLSKRFGRTHFGQHTVLLSEGDEYNYCCFDALDHTVDSLSKDVLELARASKVQPFPPNHEGLYILQTGAVKLTGRVVIMAINRNMNAFLNSKDHGISRLESFIGQLELILSMIGTGNYAKYFDVQIDFLCKYIREFESTKSFYRYAYGEFLKEAWESYSLPIEKCIEMCVRLGDAWYRMGEDLISYRHQNDNATVKLKQIVDSLRTIAELERRFAEELSAACTKDGY